MRRARAPGRVNLIGDHTDYNEGFVLPVAIGLACTLRFRPAGDGGVRLRSDAAPEEVELPADGSAEPAAAAGWGRYVAGVLRSLAARGRPPVGLAGTVSSTVPPGSGLSSSAALEVAVALALCDAAGFELAPLELARACREAELEATGVPCGIMDQLTSVCGRAGHALLIDCRDASIREIPVPEDLGIVVIHTGVPRSLEESAYAERRGACEAAARRLGVPALRDASPADVACDPFARHVVHENERVLRAGDALRAGDHERLGALMLESHASLRDDFAVSTPQLDALVSALVGAGAYGARLTGAGFGGCAVAVTPRRRAEGIAAAAAGRYRRETGRVPVSFICTAADGARVAA